MYERIGHIYKILRLGENLGGSLGGGGDVENNLPWVCQILSCHPCLQNCHKLDRTLAVLCEDF